MNFYPVFWKEILLIRKKPWRFLASSLVMPVLYLVTFGWGLGRNPFVAFTQFCCTDDIHLNVPDFIQAAMRTNSLAFAPAHRF